VRKAHAKAFAAVDGPTAWAIVDRLLTTQHWSVRVVAFELLAGHKAAFESLNNKIVDRMADGLDDWASVDLYGVTISGLAWREGLVTDRQVTTWAKSRDRWRRRLALVSTVALNSRARGGNGDAARTLAVCTLLIADRDDMVVKALSWALRELSKRDGKAVADYVSNHEAELAAQVKREVRNKLDTGLKSPRKSS
jgi:3-methyladenine DNA glycosylase AlkD